MTGPAGAETVDHPGHHRRPRGRRCRPAPPSSTPRETSASTSPPCATTRPCSRRRRAGSASSRWRARPNLLPSCATELTDGMVAASRSQRPWSRRADSSSTCSSPTTRTAASPASSPGRCTLQDYCYRYGIEQSSFERRTPQLPIESDNPMIERDMNKCILCGKCVRVCHEVQVTDAIDFTERGFDSQVAASFDNPLDTDFCRFCGQCIDICPTGAIANKQIKGARTWDRRRCAPPAPSAASAATSTSTSPTARSSASPPPTTRPPTRARCASRAASTRDLIYSPDRITTPLIKKRRRVGGRRPGTRRSTWSPRGCSRSAARALCHADRRAQLGALHQRGELPAAAAHESGPQHELHRPLRPHLTRSHGGRSGRPRWVRAR